MLEISFDLMCKKFWKMHYKYDFKHYVASNADRVRFVLKFVVVVKSGSLYFCVKGLSLNYPLFTIKGRFCFLENTESRPDAHKLQQVHPMLR